MTLKFIDDVINSKLDENEECVKFTFYELRIKYNLNETEINQFLELAKNKFENMGYRVYFADNTYIYKEIESKVQENELMIAVKS